MNKKPEIIERIIEYSIYLYILILFLTKGEAIRNILMFGSFGLWLLTLKYRNVSILKEPLPLLCWSFLFVTFLSSLFSIDPIYSLSEFKGDPRKFLITLVLFSTIMNNEIRLKRFIFVCLITLLFITSIGYYSFITQNIPLLKPVVPLMHVWHNKFAHFLNMLLPFTFIIFILTKNLLFKMLLFLSIVPSIFAVILTTSRGGIFSFISILIIWAFYFAKTKGYNLWKITALILISLLFVIIISASTVPFVKQRIEALIERDLSDINGRIVAWKATIYSVLERPLLGWGYGKEIFHREDVFKNIPSKRRPLYRGVNPFDDPHNIYLTILFHQGIVGLILYIIIILFAIKSFWTEALKNQEEIKSYILLACVSILIGGYIVHAMFTVFRLKYLAVILGIGLAAKNLDENSDR